ncbi:hypothetical protein C7450_10448 [Chelatococcus asaccharovorans]|uniref:Uncharacterized protein n=1 Tax=Chelatococcus asaccharovorans TaxID=28210 RepID=A0A2V3UAT9_9HYPH|nr:hypothetical protein C7450_10448 [Chelatococcus asaccharovorans]
MGFVQSHKLSDDKDTVACSIPAKQKTQSLEFTVVTGIVRCRTFPARTCVGDWVFVLGKAGIGAAK